MLSYGPYTFISEINQNIPVPSRLHLLHIMSLICQRYFFLIPILRISKLRLKSRIPMIGTKTDAKQRTNLARVDSQDRRNKIELVRRMMFEGGVNITSERIETFMRPTSLVPTRVWCQ